MQQQPKSTNPSPNQISPPPLVKPTSVQQETDSELEIKNLKAEIEQLKLQNQQQGLELKYTQKNPKDQTSVQPPKSMLSLPSISQTIPQTLMAPPKLKATSDQLELQDQLIAACKRGDEKGVKAVLDQGAKPDMPNAKGEQPLGAAVWGMCPDVVNALLKQADGVAPMTWQECEQHNQKYYEEVFIVSKFNPQAFDEWNALLEDMDPNPFVRALHLKKVDEVYRNSDSSSWENLCRHVKQRAWMAAANKKINFIYNCVAPRSEAEYASYRSQVQHAVETAKRPEAEIIF